MASSCVIEEPQVLLSLPRPLDVAESNISVAPVWGLAQSRKRKRPELVVGIDGECVNVYDLQNPRILASHAIPPQVHLTAAPHSLRQRGRARAFRRFTYAAIRNDFGASKQQVWCFREDAVSSTDGAAVPVKTATDIGSLESPVVHLESIVAYDSDSHSMLAVQQDGTLTCFSQDLAETAWSTKLQFTSSPSGPASHIDFVRCFDAAHAVQGIFKNRAEVLAILQPTAAPDIDSLRHLQVLFATTHNDDHTAHQAHAFCIRPSSSVASQRFIAQHLCTWYLPSPTTGARLVLQQHIDPRTAVFQFISGSSLINLDLSSPTARPVSTFAPIPFSATFIPVSSKLSLISSKTSCQLYDLHYKSLQAVQTATAAQAVSAGNRKRKRASLGSAGNQPVRLVQHFARLGLVIGILSHDIIGYSVRLPTPSRSRPEHGSRLIDAIGRAAPSPANPEHHGDFKTLTQLADKRDVSGFEKLFFEKVAQKHKGQSPLSEDRIGHLARCALASIFTRDDSAEKHSAHFGSSDGIRVKFLPTNVFRWLSLYQLVKPEHISTALQHVTSPTARLANISYEGIATAVANADPSLVLLSDLVIKNTLASHTGLVRALRILLRSFDSPAIPDADRMLTDGKDPSPDPNVAPENQVEAEESAAQWDLDIASIMLEDGPSGRGLALRTCCEKLAGGWSARQVVRALREQMSRRDLALLAELLRFELANGGWTSRCLDVFPDQVTEPAGQDGVIWVICELLNRTLDALGTGGWLGLGGAASTSGFGRATGTEDDDADDDDGDDDEAEGQDDDEFALIKQLREDTSAVIEGVQESSFFTGFLRDFIRFSETQQKSGRQAGASSGPGSSIDGVIVSAADKVLNPILPLGLKSVQRISSTRVRAGGEIQKRTKRDVAMKLAARVGVYSFETIRV